ncbi:M48 family metallopeptidase [Amycolatopsis roodepoortensis]|uniref:M48 family metallopeptidase n=1 Tax=Amycolatopsis roodepoortensis TaxID=700274 RepID=UPI00214C970C|nr:M48 family metallopeptidase [Amycolatopsis roodepoortensis]UUV34325.1 M48 family metallopeptidase [Amycolatopsis roodepoortensis]
MRVGVVKVVVLVVGFYALATLIFLLLAFGGGFLLAGIDNVPLFILAGLGLGSLLGAGVVALLPMRPVPFVPKGVPLYRDDAPELWATLTELAETIGTRPPDQVWLTAGPGASVVEEARLFGLKAGRRFLSIGLPTLQAFTRAQARAVLAHEFAHYAQLDGRTSVTGYRSHVAVARMLDRFPRSTINPLTWLFRGYARLFVLAQRVASRRREYGADQVMGRIAGRAAAHSALRLHARLGEEWTRYLSVHVGPGADVGMAPDDVYGGFAGMLEARRERLATVDEPIRLPSRWDTHPPTTERLWALDTAPDKSDVDERPAVGLLADPVRSAARLEEASFDFGECRRLPWDTYPREVALARLKVDAEAAYRAIARASGQPGGSLEALLTLPGADVPEDGLTAAVVLAALAAGTMRFVHRWDDEPDFVLADGSFLDFDLVEDLLIGEPEHAARARAALARLGIDPAAAHGGAERLSPGEAPVIGGLANVKFDDRPGHLVITERGLIFSPDPEAEAGSGKDALLALMAQAPFAVAARAGAVWLPYEEFSHVEKQRDIPLKATVTLYNGVEHRIHTVYTGYVHEKSHETILRVLR